MSAVAVTGWLLVAVGVVACGWIAYRSEGRFPSLVDVARAVVDVRAGRWLVTALWVWTGVHLFVRHG